jgi:hypothetical protein
MSSRPWGWGIIIFSLGFFSGCASSVSAGASAPLPRDVAACPHSIRGEELDARLMEARQPLFACVAERARHGLLAEAHRCYRALRLLESARWWHKSLLDVNEMTRVYQPSETHRQEFLCRIEQLARARTPDEVERLYIEMIRSYP